MGRKSSDRAVSNASSSILHPNLVTSLPQGFFVKAAVRQSLARDKRDVVLAW